MHEAKSNLSRLVRDLREGREREILICLSGEPIAKIVPIDEAPRRELGVDRDVVVIGPDFDAMNEEIADLFEGR